MSAFQRRVERITARIQEAELDLLLVNQLVNVRYLTGFTGTNGAFLVGSDRRMFLTDFRYVEQAAREVPDFERVNGLGEWAGWLPGTKTLTVLSHDRVLGLTHLGQDLDEAAARSALHGLARRTLGRW